MLSREPALAERAKTWQFLEVWIDPFLSPPRLMMVVGEENGTCQILDPIANYKLVTSYMDYESARDWLLEDEYERVQGKLLAKDIL